MEKQISIIIPTYNMAAYIGKCLDSLIIPEFDQVEVLVVNDGSKDSSSEIAHSYAERYPDSIRVIDKENGNYGSCINAALPLCTGRYVKVLDADDTFNSSAFSIYVQTLSEHNEDVLINDYVKVYENGESKKCVTFSDLGYVAGKLYSFVDSFRYIREDIHMHCVAYKLNNLIKINYKQTEGVSYTDSEWVFVPIAVADTFSFINCGALYRYLLGRQGQTVDPKLSLQRIGDHYVGLTTQAQLFEKMALSDLRKKYLESQICIRIKCVYTMAIESRDESVLHALSVFDQQLKLISPEIYEMLNEISFTPHFKYNFIKQFRHSRYSTQFTLNRFPLFFERVLGVALKLIRKFLCR